MLLPSIFGEDLFDDLFDGLNRPAARKSMMTIPGSQVMRTDIKEHENAFELLIDLPGYKKEDLKAELKDGYLTITATHNDEKNEGDEKSGYIRRERYCGTSSRSFYVGENLMKEDIKAKFDNGVLDLLVPKKEEEPEEEEAKFISID